MRQTEIEVEEKEVERVYCDNCSDECTDSHIIEPRELCPSCQSGRRSFKAMERFNKKFASDEDEEWSWFVAVTFAVLAPVITSLAIPDAIFESDDASRVWRNTYYYTPITGN